MSTTSDEAAKMMHATLWQDWSFRNDPTLGGTATTLNAALNADPNCIMAHVLQNLAANAANEKYRSGNQMQNAEKLLKLADDIKANERERMHCKAVYSLARGKLDDACRVWDRLLAKYPRDTLALQLAFYSFIHSGRWTEQRDLTNRVLPHYNPKEIGYGFLLGLHSFALEENGDYAKAEKIGKQALYLNPHDGWATHAMSHVYEMQGRVQEGIQFMESTEDNWKGSDMIAHHNYWHWALFNVENGQYDEALSLFDDHIQPIALQRGTSFSGQDTASLLFRLEMEGVNVGGRWSEVCKAWSPRANDHVFAFSDVHMLMAFLGANDTQKRDEFVHSLDEYLNSESCEDNHRVSVEVGSPLSQAIIAYKDGNYADCVELLYPLRYEIWKIGASHAQRDLFAMLLINAALKSSDVEHRVLAKHLCVERKALKTNSPMTDRWMDALNA
ncbi:hypothetical protein CAPTEDRAFT_178724 [Capitella teleta]|uniref:Tetratricopeptide repeat protein 38 n=1 Tax=Capitella teleta TaxID=283909 RepID=R7TI04_CAPTE|nr:hypothetical protein CAPTEDRAFT_178724 [Capitella teleta]|eukprot:ELT91181.1 hypothetical protein CAPTEDRAFT_178724 [Capitella teleta]